VVKDQTKEIANKALTQLSQALAGGKSEALTRYLSFMSRFHRYSFWNCALIFFQFPEATNVAGFVKWKEVGRYVKKGEKGIAILVPLKYKAKAKESSDDDETLVGFTTGYVFDVAQTEGESIPEIGKIQGDPGIYKFRLTNVILEKGIELGYVPNLDGAKGVSRGGRIELVEGMPAAEEFQVLAHELAHELLHRGDRRSETDTRIRELEAESVAFVCCSAIGLETGSASADYITLYQGNEKLLAQSLSFVQSISSQILESILHPPAIGIMKLSCQEQREIHELHASDPEAAWLQCEDLGFTGYSRTHGLNHPFEPKRAEGEDFILLNFEPDSSNRDDGGHWTVAYREVN